MEDGLAEARPWRFGLRQRITTLVLLVPSTVVLVALPLLFEVQHKRAEAEFLEKLTAEAQVLSMALADRCTQGCLHDIEPPVDDLLRNEPDLLWIAILDGDSGAVLGTWGQISGAPPPMAQSLEGLDFGVARDRVIVNEIAHAAGLLHGAGHLFTAITPLKTSRWQGHPRPVLRIQATSLAYNQRVNELMTLALAPGLLAGAGGLLLAFWLNRRLREGIGSLLKATGEIAEGRFDRRVSVRRGDELHPLGSAVNTMAGALATQRERLAAHALTLEDTVAQRTLELEKTRAIALGQERVAAMGILAAGVAHEIGNPLTAISAIVQGLKAEGVDPEGQVTVLAENLERIRHIVRSLVTYARPPTTTWSYVSINDILRRTLDLVRLDPRAKDVRFEAQLDRELPSVRSVEGKLQQIFLNLFLNALHAIGPAGGNVRVTTAAEKDAVTVRVDDDGPGVPPELRQKILDAFFTTRAAEGGTGLGLALSVSLAEELGGSLAVAESPLGGASFELTFPAPLQEEPS